MGEDRDLLRLLETTEKHLGHARRLLEAGRREEARHYVTRARNHIASLLATLSRRAEDPHSGQVPLLDRDGNSHTEP